LGVPGADDRDAAGPSGTALQMSTILARCAALAIIAAGFALTGDLGWLAERGMRVINAEGVPSDAAAADAGPTAPGTWPQPAGGTAPDSSAAGRDSASAASPADSAPQQRASETKPETKPGQPGADGLHDGAPVARAIDFRPPQGGPERADIAGLRPGSRVVAWLSVARRPGAPAAYSCLVIDVVDPASAEALVYEAASFADDGRPIAAASPPRRVRIAGAAAGPQAGTIARGGMILVRHVGIAHAAAHEQTETVGPIVALAVTR